MAASPRRIRIATFSAQEPGSGVRSAQEPGSGVRSVTSGYSRVRFLIERRSPHLELRAAAHGRGALAPLPDPRSVAVFEHAPESVPQRTFTVCACPACPNPGCACTVCGGSGRVQAWVEVRVSRHYQVVVHGEGAARSRHTNVEQAEDFDRSEWPNQMVHQAWFRGVPGHLSQALHPRVSPAHEQVLWALVQTFVG